MGASKLQIKLLSSSGELLNVVNVASGRLTVLRAFTASQLEPYKRAIAGVPGPERITVTLNGNEFVPDNHILIGFGENANSLPGTVTEFLAASGVNTNNIHGLLMSYGLTEVADAPFSKLSTCQTQRVRLLAAMQQNSKLIVLNNPFEPLGSDWRENFAQMLIKYVRATPNPVLVTSMTYRPECFINNEIIQRVQVGENDQRTIGFGSEPSEYDDLIKQIRSDKPKKQPKQSPKQSSTKKDQVFPDSRPQRSAAKEKPRSGNSKKRKAPPSYGIGKLMRHRSVRRIGLFSVLGLVILVSVMQQQEPEKNGVKTVAKTADKEKKQVALLKLKKDTSPPGLPTDAVKPSPPKPKAAPPKPQKKPKNAAKKKAASSSKVASKKKDSPPPKESPYLLDMYRASIKQSVIASFEGTEGARAANLQLSQMGSATKDSSDGRKKQANAFTSSLLSDLQKTDGSGEHLPDRKSPSTPGRSSASSRSPLKPPSAGGKDQPDFKNMSKEERRALLREKFRLAIERAAANKR